MSWSKSKPPSGTPSGARTRDPAVKEPWLNLLANGSILGSFFSYQGDLSVGSN